MNAELLMQVKALDPAPADAELPTAMAAADVVLAAIDERSRTVQTRERVDVIHREPRRRWAPAVVALVAFAAVLAAGVVIWLIGTGDEPPVVTEPPTTTTQAASSTTAAAPEPGTFAADATTINSRSTDLSSGTYRFDTLGTPFSLTVDIPAGVFVEVNSRAFLVLNAPNSRVPSDKDMVFMRLPALSDPSAPYAPLEEQSEGWPADDFGGWLDNLDDAITVTYREETTIGGLAALRADLEVGDIQCLEDGPYCALFATNPPPGTANSFSDSWSKGLNRGALYRIWVVDQGNEAPLAIVLGVLHEGDLAWLDAFETMVSTIGFGDIAPNPNDS